ncbi:hypothetical protein HJG60_011612 [Phyllostomus discolor]|uniref:Uncharacterized protein n=1 Tax=Phyllostomus discolor TaxID=89673 RepID=A0A833ZNX6_9CHIR|nr:hypothetical protein HJG60_011612 [Phyllostomus discolor]
MVSHYLTFPHSLVFARYSGQSASRLLTQTCAFPGGRVIPRRSRLYSKAFLASLIAAAWKNSSKLGPILHAHLIPLAMRSVSIQGHACSSDPTWSSPGVPVNSESWADGWADPDRASRLGPAAPANL